MKNAIEQMLSMMIIVFILFLFTSFAFVEIRTIGARNALGRVVEYLQAEGKYTSSILTTYKNKYPGFSFKLEGDSVLVKYQYSIDVPFIGKFENLEMIGYAR